MKVLDRKLTESQNQFFSLLVCPVSRSPLTLTVLEYRTKKYGESLIEIPWLGILYANEDWFYPIIDGIPRLLVESFLDYEDFCKTQIADYENRKDRILAKHGELVKTLIEKNKQTKKSFELEWGIFNYETDKTWDANSTELLNRFLEETDETRESLNGKIIFDAGCGNGQLNGYIASSGALIVGMDLSKSIVRAFEKNNEPNAVFIQGDIQFPPLKYRSFDMVHSSGVLICTNNTKYSFGCIEKCVAYGGKLSVWLYHPRKNLIHRSFNFMRRYTSKLPLQFQYYLYRFTLLPASYVVKRLKRNKQTTREMLIDILDWFTPEFRWEHTETEAESWYQESLYESIKVTTRSLFGFNIIGIKKKSAN